MKKIVLTFFILLNLNTFAQIQENMLMERFFMNAFNPAYVGSEGKTISVITRTAWSGIADSPQTNYLYYSGAPKKNLSFGLSVISNKVFIDTRSQYTLDASYRLKLNGSYFLNLGIKAGLASKNTDLNALDRITVEDNPFISTTEQGSYPVFGLGFLIQGDTFFFSLGTPSFINPEKYINDATFIQNQNPVLYLVTGTNIDFGFFDSSLKPYLSVKFIPKTTNQINVGANYNYNDIFELGGGYKTTDYIYIMALLKLKIGIDIGYATDFGVGNNASVPRSGYELFAKYRFSVTKKEVDIKKPPTE
ncbi:PorP/SprF family type IX secretion system membrane protein [Flavobacteriaceae bacterium]|jgi:type IX secretion system PorP/SprF family membrane protein|nr:PorP/SprF family type IX secretion system membrane protein [Flavobacteriaceae bacterium]